MQELKGAAPAREYLTAAEVAELVGVNVKTIRKWVRLGKFPHIPLIGAGHDYRFLKASVDEWARQRELGNPKQNNIKAFCGSGKIAFTRGNQRNGMGFQPTPFFLPLPVRKSVPMRSEERIKIPVNLPAERSKPVAAGKHPIRFLSLPSQRIGALG